MQLAGFTLATKQSSVTAAKLAGSIKVLGGELDPSPIVAEIARVTRSQLAAIAGNLGMVIPTALLVDLLVKSLTGHSYLNAEQAGYVLHSLDPFHTLTVFYAALTGVVLWSSSLAAGWLENWSAYRRIPEALASHRGIVKRLGTMRAARLSRWFAHNVSGLGGNISIGLLLGMLPVFGKFLGLPIDVRHVTLSTGQLAWRPGTRLPEDLRRCSSLTILLIALQLRELRARWASRCARACPRRDGGLLEPSSSTRTPRVLSTAQRRKTSSVSWTGRTAMNVRAAILAGAFSPDRRSAGAP
jgi:hypothetical protein